MDNSEKISSEKIDNTRKILGVAICSTTLEEVLKKICRAIKEKRKIFVATPNPEFLVFAHEHPWFKKILAKADISLPDGIGLIWAGKILGLLIKERVTGADLAEKLMILANKNRWRVGIIGARRGVKEEREKLVINLKKKYPNSFIDILEDTPLGTSKKWEIIFACQGMGEQERWIVDNLKKMNALVFIGAGGSLDFLGGFASRAPFCIRKIGFEWLWRLIHEPWRWRRQLKLIKFLWLVLKERGVFLFRRINNN